MRKSNIQQLTLAAMVAAVYFVLCYFGNIFQLTFGPVQVRLGEALTVLPFLFPAAAPGLALGCLLTNILSPYGPIDMIVGTLATAIAAFLSIKMPRWYLAALPPIVVNALLLPPMWAWAEAGAINGAFWAAYGLNLWTFVAGEAVACCVLGTILLKALPRVNRGVGYDQELLPWLETYTFPVEARYGDTDFAEAAWKRFLNRMWANGTLRFSTFATIHKEAAWRLMELTEQAGLSALIGKVNMDRNAPDSLREDTDASLADTEELICRSRAELKLSLIHI